MPNKGLSALRISVRRGLWMLSEEQLYSAFYQFIRGDEHDYAVMFGEVDREGWQHVTFKNIYTMELTDVWIAPTQKEIAQNGN